MKKKLKKYIKKVGDIVNKYPVIVFYVLSNFINATLLRLFTTKTLGFRVLFVDLSFTLLLASISLLLKKSSRNIYYIITSIIMVICCLINSIYYNYYNSFVSVSLLATSVFVKDVGDAVLDVVLRPTDLIYLWLLIGLFIIIKKKKTDSSFNKKSFLKTFLVAFICLAIGCSLPPYYSFGRLINLWNRVSVVNTSGIYIYQIDDIIQSLKPKFNNIFGHDKALKKVKDYYNDNRRMQSINKYTGIFEGKNVIAIHAESLQTFAMNLSFNEKELTPNLNKLAKTGIFFNNFYAQEGVGTSSDSEFTYATGLLPANIGTAFVNYFENKYVTIQNLLKNKGYYVFSMHGNVGSFWNRDVMYQNIGYDKFYSKSSFEIDEEFGLGLSDKSFFRQTVPMIKEIKTELEKPYYGTLITLTNHTPWKDADKFNDYSISIPVEKNGTIIQNDYLSDKTMGRYLKSVHYMDSAIGQFISDMDEEGLLDNTIIVIYGDHDAKLFKKQFEYLYNYDIVNDKLYHETDPEYVEFNDYDYILNKKVPFIIWSKDLPQGITVDTPMGMIDVSMTLGNMLGIYNKYSLGQDVMNIKKEDGIVVFKDGSYITDKIYYNSRNNEIYSISNEAVSSDYLKKNSKYANDIISVSYDIITYDLLRDLE